jgi:predicted ATPase with chaperone activity
MSLSVDRKQLPEQSGDCRVNLKDLKEQYQAKRAMEAARAAGHSVTMS